MAVKELAQCCTHPQLSEWGGGGGKNPRSELRYLGCKVEGVTTLPGLGVQDSRQARGQGGEESVE